MADALAFLGRKKRDLNSINDINNTMLYKVPDVSLNPCIRRFLCELETVAKTSDNYLPEEPAIDYDRIVQEEEAPEQADPLKEMHIEAVRALFRDEDPTGEINLRSRRAVDVMNGLTGGSSCEQAYKQCPGRFSAPMVFRAVFDEFNMEVHDEL
ncbi:unnamed protein product [Meganyctiphanes norvegica]|uniref:Uncharacterized protein n=1 Tax=Meganyctiphanes norvegica TaxID=48144 RepID=A0AAV2QRG4_MEGNR